MSPNGAFAYVANQNSNNVSAYTINAVTGALTPVAGSPFPAGSNPASVVAVSVAASTNSADLAVTKSGPAIVIPGGIPIYTITVTNNGPSDALTVVLADPVPPNTTFNSVFSLLQTTGPLFSCAPPGVQFSVICTIATLASGASATFTVAFNVNNPLPSNFTTLSNTATISSATADPVPGNNSSTSSASVATSAADLVITKSGPASVVAGNNLSYTITVTNTVTNNGASDAQNVVLADPLPPNTTFVSEAQNTGPAFVCTTPPVGGTGSVSCTIATLAAGASATFTVELKVDANTANGTTISNTATIASATADPTPGNNSSTSAASVTTSADVAVTKSGPASVVAGTNLSYDLTVTNSGPSSAQNVALADTLPANTTFVSATQNSGPVFVCSTPAVGGSGSVNCTLGTLAAGASASFTLVVAAGIATPGGTILTETASVSSATSDPTPGNNSASASTTVSASPADVSLTKTASAASATVGSTVTYTLVASNAGPGPATNVVVTDVLPAGAGLVSATSTQGSCSGTTTVICSLGTIASGSSATITLALNLPATSGPISNSATVATSTPDPNTANNSSTATVVAVTAIPTLSPLGTGLLALMLVVLAALRRRRFGTR